MINNKFKLLTLSVALLGLASCSSGGGTVVTDVDYGTPSNDNITVWCPNGDNDVMKTVIAGYKAANPTYTGDITIAANYGEGEITANLTKDVAAAADVMCIADDNIRACVKAGALARLTNADKTEQVTENGQVAVDAGSQGGYMYGYAYRADNSYPLFYDSTFFSADDVLSLDTMLAKAKASNKKVYFDLGGGWYAPSFFWANGCKLWLGDDGSQQSDFNSEAGVKAAEAMMTMYQTYGGSTFIWSSDPAEIEAGFASGEIGAAILWNDYTSICGAMTTAGKDAKNLKLTKLPTMKINGVDKQLGAFIGYKYVSVKYIEADTKSGKTARAMDFAKYVANVDNQKTRATELGYGPSNKALAAHPDIQALPFIAAVAAQASTGVTAAQGLVVNGDFWTPMADFTSIIKNSVDGSWGDYTGAKEALDALVEAFAA
ncbi:MAG: extracellular solute-binding protein [Bacilli bacterium]|nr:extracellular solute-binding protein [Bacilli bacterium]